MIRPFDVVVVAKVEGELSSPSFHVLADRSVVDAMDWDLASISLIIEAISLLRQAGDVYGRDSQFVFIDAKVRKRLLGFGFDFGENDILRIMMVEDNFAEKIPIAFFSVISEEIFEVWIELEGFDVLA